MHPFLITLAALCSLPYATRQDGETTTVHRTDMGESAPAVTEDQLVSAIADAIRKLQGNQAPEPTEDMEDPDALKARIQELEGQLAAMQQEKADRDAAMAAEQEKADRADMDGLADRLGFDRSGWTDDTTSQQRKLDLATHKGLLPKGTELQSETKADGVPVAKLDGMVSALQTMHPAPPKSADPYAHLRVDAKPPAGDDNWGGPRNRKDGEDKPADPMKANIAKRNRDRRSGAAQ